MKAKHLVLIILIGILSIFGVLVTKIASSDSPCKCKSWMLVPAEDGKYRLLTERECWRLMGFDDSDFEVAKEANNVPEGKMNRTLYRQAGNSMPVPVLEEIFNNIDLENLS